MRQDVPMTIEEGTFSGAFLIGRKKEGEEI